MIELARPVMGTIFLVMFIVDVCKKKNDIQTELKKALSLICSFYFILY